MKKYAFLILVVCLSLWKIAFAQPYPVHDLNLLLTESKKDGEAVHSLNLKYIDQMIYDLRIHARDYP
ncbi:MAG: hypothetical protein ACRCWR_13480, partial [Saezia sp.]